MSAGQPGPDLRGATVDGDVDAVLRGGAVEKAARGGNSLDLDTAQLVARTRVHVARQGVAAMHLVDGEVLDTQLSEPRSRRAHAFQSHAAESRWPWRTGRGRFGAMQQGHNHGAVLAVLKRTPAPGFSLEQVIQGSGEGFFDHVRFLFRLVF